MLGCYAANQTSTSHRLMSRAQEIYFNALLVKGIEFAAWALKRGAHKQSPSGKI